MKLLSKVEFSQTFAAPMQRVPRDASPPFDFWDYFGAIPEEDFQGCDCSAACVENAWTDATGNFQHVLVSSKSSNIFIVMVLDLVAGEVHGHHLLDLNREYGLENES